MKRKRLPDTIPALRRLLTLKEKRFARVVDHMIRLTGQLKGLRAELRRIADRLEDMTDDGMVDLQPDDGRSGFDDRSDLQ